MIHSYNIHFYCFIFFIFFLFYFIRFASPCRWSFTPNTNSRSRRRVQDIFLEAEKPHGQDIFFLPSCSCVRVLIFLCAPRHAPDETPENAASRRFDLRVVLIDLIVYDDPCPLQTFPRPRKRYCHVIFSRVKLSLIISLYYIAIQSD